MSNKRPRNLTFSNRAPQASFCKPSQKSSFTSKLYCFWFIQPKQRRSKVGSNFKSKTSVHQKAYWCLTVNCHWLKTLVKGMNTVIYILGNYRASIRGRANSETSWEEDCAQTGVNSDPCSSTWQITSFHWIEEEIIKASCPTTFKDTGGHLESSQIRSVNRQRLNDRNFEDTAWLAIRKTEVLRFYCHIGNL